MTEQLLHFIWQFQYFNTKSLSTEQGEFLQIVSVGQYNSNQGPDFSEAKIIIDGITLVGNIELHINASDWHKHQHSKDTNYGNIILHVIWNNDQPVNDAFGKSLPTLLLQPLVAKVLLQRYQELMQQNMTTIVCANYLPALTTIGWMSWKERLAIERLEIKAIRVFQLYEQSNHHWEEVFWWMLASNFGIKINAECFEGIAKTISINILAKHKYQIHQLEALLLGQAGLLEGNFTEDYPIMLQREYKIYQRKYSIPKAVQTPVFLRMRPATFPTIRLAQLAMLIHNSSHLFSKVKDITDIKDIKNLLNVSANDYWIYHYKFDELTDFKPKKLGAQMIQNIIINTIVPIVFAYGWHHKEELYKDKAIQWLQLLPPEQNTITKSWKQFKINNHSAFDSQSLLHLNNQYCATKKCLQCAVGNKLMEV
jgi:hypothetical protein